MFITVATPPFTDIALFDKFTAELGVPAGMRGRYAGTAEDGTLRIVVLWDSPEHADAFFTQVLGPATARLLGPEPGGRPEVIRISVERELAA